MKYRLLLAGLVLGSIALACSAPSYQRVPFPSQKVIVTSADVTRIYVVREDSGIQKREVRIIDGDREIGELTTDTYLCWERPGGRTLGRAFYAAIDPSRGRLDGIGDFDCAAGRAYYFNVRVGKEDGRPYFEQLDAEAGPRLVAKRKPAEQR